MASEDMPSPPALTWRRIASRMRGSQNFFRWFATWSTAASLSGSDAKKFEMSFAIVTRSCTFIASAPSARVRERAVAGGALRLRAGAPGIRLRDLDDLD